MTTIREIKAPVGTASINFGASGVIDLTATSARINTVDITTNNQSTTGYVQKSGSTMTGQLVTPNSGSTTAVIAPLGNLTTGVAFNSTVAGFVSNGRSSFLSVSNPALGVGSDVQAGSASDAYTTMTFPNTAGTYSMISAAASNAFAINRGLPQTGTSFLLHDAATSTATLGNSSLAAYVSVGPANIVVSPLAGTLSLGGDAFFTSVPYAFFNSQTAGATIPLGANANSAIAIGPYTSLANQFTISNGGVITYTGARTRTFKIDFSVTFTIQSNVLATMTFWLVKGAIVAPINDQPKGVFQAAVNGSTACQRSVSFTQVYSLATNDTVQSIMRSSLLQVGPGVVVRNQSFTISSLMD